MKSPEASDFLLVPWHPVTITPGHKTAKTNAHPGYKAAASWKSGDGRGGLKLNSWEVCEGELASGERHLILERAMERVLVEYPGLQGSSWILRDKDELSVSLSPIYSLGLGGLSVLKGPTTSLK